MLLLTQVSHLRNLNTFINRLTRCTVLTPSPLNCATSRMEYPLRSRLITSLYSAFICSAVFTEPTLRPSFPPFSIYRFRPDNNRNEILSRSNCAQAPSNGFLSSFVSFYFLSFLMLIYSFITDYKAFSLRYKDNTTRDKNETKVGKQSANLGKNNEPIQNRLSFLIDCKSVTLHYITLLSFYFRWLDALGIIGG